MSTKYKFHEAHTTYFVTFTVVDWVDIFTRDYSRKIIYDSIIFCQEKKDWIIHAYVIMSNHIHLILSYDGHLQSLSDTVRDMKGFTSKKILAAIQSEVGESRRDWMLERFQQTTSARQRQRLVGTPCYQLWQHSNKPIPLWSRHVIQQKLDYIHLNPVKAGWVDRPEDYLHSSARDYLGQAGQINVDCIEYWHLR